MKGEGNMNSPHFYSSDCDIEHKKRITSTEFLDNLTEFLCDAEGITTEELREDLEAKGIDTEKVLANVEAMLRKYGFHKAADRMSVS